MGCYVRSPSEGVKEKDIVDKIPHRSKNRACFIDL